MTSRLSLSKDVRDLLHWYKNAYNYESLAYSRVTHFTSEDGLTIIGLNLDKYNRNKLEYISFKDNKPVYCTFIPRSYYKRLLTWIGCYVKIESFKPVKPPGFIVNTNLGKFLITDTLVRKYVETKTTKN